MEAGPVELDFTKTERFGPFGVALIASTLLLRTHAGRATTMIPPEDESSAGFLKEVGLGRLAEGHGATSGTLEIRQLLANDPTFTNCVATILLKGVPGMTEDKTYPIELCLNELLQNVFEWSKSAIGCTVLSRWYKRNMNVRLAIVDRGIGIPAALRRKRVRGLHRANDADVIEAAVTQPKLTSRDNEVGGLGLKTIHGEVVTPRRGRMTILSHNAKVVWTEKGVRKHKSPYLRGTAVMVEFRPDADLVYDSQPMSIF
jgi:anti-sigma regulatory factor (Ser/Thr protein kinase)